MRLTIVGGGLTGLVAAIEGAELGWDVSVHEARSILGGRAGTLAGPYRANRGPHALYTDGPLWSWLERRGLTPPVVAAHGPSLFRVGGTVQSRPLALVQAIAGLPAVAPVGESFRRWLSRHIDDPELVEAVVGLAFVLTLDHNPGRLSAAFVHERLRRGGDAVRYVQGGWARMIDLLALRAADLGVRLIRDARVHGVPEGPSIVATTLAAARRLTGDLRLDWTGTRTAFVDLGLGPGVTVPWFRLSDLDQRIYAARYSEVDPSLAPRGHHLIQVAAAIDPDERLESAVTRVHGVLDASVAGWERHLRWKRAYELSNSSGAVDLPGTTWRDRPAVRRSRTLAVATDQSAAPGLFSEVAHVAVRSAVASFRDTETQ